MVARPRQVRISSKSLPESGSRVIGKSSLVKQDAGKHKKINGQSKFASETSKSQEVMGVADDKEDKLPTQVTDKTTRTRRPPKYTSQALVTNLMAADMRINATQQPKQTIPASARKRLTKFESDSTPTPMERFNKVLKVDEKKSAKAITNAQERKRQKTEHETYLKSKPRGVELPKIWCEVGCNSVYSSRKRG